MSQSILDPNNFNQTNKILNDQAMNGRINIIQEPSPEEKFKMFEKVAIKNKTTEYREAFGGNLESNVLAQVFFSAENIQIIQNGLRAGVYKASNEKILIAPQSIDTLKIITRSTYFRQYAEHREGQVTQEVERLNKMVLDYCVPNVYA